MPSLKCYENFLKIGDVRNIGKKSNIVYVMGNVSCFERNGNIAVV